MALARRLLRDSGWTGLRFGLDATLLVAAVVAAQFGAAAAQVSVDGATLVWLFPPGVLGLMALRGMYSGELQVRVLDGVGHTLGATSLVAATLIAAAAFLDPSADPAPLVARAWLFSTLYLVAGRALLAYSQRRARASRLISKPTLIVGAGSVGVQVERRLQEQPHFGLEPVGYLDSNPPGGEMVPPGRGPVLGSSDDLDRVVRETGARHIVFSFTSSPDSVLVPLIRRCEELGLEVSLVPRLFESVNVHFALDHIGGLPLFGLHTVDPKGWQFAVKHALDRLLAGILLLVLGLPMLAIALAVRISSPGPVFFRQRRVGQDGTAFDMLKFRTMQGDPAETGEADAEWATETMGLDADLPPAQKRQLEDRRTPVGTLLRRLSMDELPQLVNVLRGEMSLVGPRPERSHYVDMFGASVRRYQDRHRVKSGLTGWAQVHGLRGNTSLADRVDLDNYYIENWTLWLDVKILLMTIQAVLGSPRE